MLVMDNDDWRWDGEGDGDTLFIFVVAVAVAVAVGSTDLKIRLLSVYWETRSTGLAGLTNLCRS